jgi:glutamate-ammonia-ligase adenylyltransferase
MALTRARVIAGDADFAKEIEAATRATLCVKRDSAATAKDVRGMRALIAQEKGDKDPWDLKLVSGGLLDIEFIAQFLVLAWAHERPKICDVSTRAVIARAGAEGLLTLTQAEDLTDAHRLFTSVTQIMRVAVEGPFDPAVAAGGVKRLIAAAAALPDFDALAEEIGETRKKVREVFEEVLAAPRRR